MTIIVQTLAENIEQRLSSLSGSARCALPVRLVAAQVAASQMMLLDEWLGGRGNATTLQITSALHRSSHVLIRELVVRPRVWRLQAIQCSQKDPCIDFSHRAL